MEGGFHTGRLAALQFPAYQSEPLGEPSDGVEPVQDMTGPGKITMNSCAIGVGTVGDHSLHVLTPSGSLRDEKPAQSSFGASFNHRQQLSGVTARGSRSHNDAVCGSRSHRSATPDRTVCDDDLGPVPTSHRAVP